MIIRRIVRAGLKLYHYVAGGWGDIERYREENQYALDNPAEVAIDYFGNSPEGPKVLQVMLILMRLTTLSISSTRWRPLHPYRCTAWAMAMI